LKEAEFKVLKTMSEATTRMDLNTFAQKVNLTATETTQEIQELARKGFLQKVGSGYGITEKGKAAIRAYTPVPSEKSFQFYSGIDLPLGFTAQTIEEFYRITKQVYSDSLEFHLYRGDFEKWFSEVVKDSELANAVDGLKISNLKGEPLRKELLKTINAKYNIEEL